MTFDFDGAPVSFRSGMTIAAALWASGRRAWRLTHRGQMPRGYYCGDGFCYDCLVVVGKRDNVLACQAPAADGLRVRPQVGFGG